MGNGSIAFVAALLMAGFVAGLFRRRWAARRRGAPTPGRGRLVGIAAALAIAIPVALILLAKLFNSDVLGWMFGLTLMFGFALLPCGAIVLIGFAAGSFVARRRGVPSALPATTPADQPIDAPATCTVRIDRDSVHASDEPQAETIAVSPGTTWLVLLERVSARRYLPGISGGQATWVAELRGAAAPTRVAVCAQQWSSPRLLVPNGAAAPLFRNADVSLHFCYLCQQDPDAVFAHEAAHTPA
jgi:hypothetical protein